MRISNTLQTTDYHQSDPVPLFHKSDHSQMLLPAKNKIFRTKFLFIYHGLKYCVIIPHKTDHNCTLGYIFKIITNAVWLGSICEIWNAYLFLKCPALAGYWWISSLSPRGLRTLICSASESTPIWLFFCKFRNPFTGTHCKVMSSLSTNFLNRIRSHETVGRAAYVW
jgi:hypothetical protein